MMNASRLADFEIAQIRPRYRIDPQLDVEIVEHAVATAHGPRTATSFVTHGLRTEVVLTWCGPRLIGTPCAEAIAALRALGRAPEAIRSGGWFHLGEGALLEGVGLAGFVFVPAQAMPGVTPPRGGLHAIAVTSGELAAAAEVSVMRVTGRIGQRFDRFPVPPWSTPRMSVARAGEPTVLARVRRIDVPGLVVALDGLILSIDVPAAAREAFAEAIAEPDDGVAIPAFADPRADAQLVWLAGAPRGKIFRAPHARAMRTAGSFLRLTAGDTLSACAIEDGFTLSLDPESRATLWAAVTSGHHWVAKATAGHVQVRIT